MRRHITRKVSPKLAIYFLKVEVLSVPPSRSEQNTIQDDNCFLALVLIKSLKELLRSEVNTAVREAVLEAADNLAQRPLVYTADQAARVLQVSRRTVDNLVADGVLARLPHTSRLLIPRIAVEAYVNSAMQ